MTGSMIVTNMAMSLCELTSALTPRPLTTIQAIIPRWRSSGARRRWM